jgi:hypothetical protein
VTLKRDDRKWIGSEELLAELERDPEYQARIAEQERRRLVLVERNLEDARPLVAQLAARGFVVQTPADLFNKRMNYRAAIPTLIEWLPRISNPDVKADVARTLSVKWAKPAAIPVLLDEFERSENDVVRWAIASALESSPTPPPSIRSHGGQQILDTGMHAKCLFSLSVT